MSWDVRYLPEADKDLDNLSRRQQMLVKSNTNLNLNFTNLAMSFPP